MSDCIKCEHADYDRTGLYCMLVEPEIENGECKDYCSKDVVEGCSYEKCLTCHLLNCYTGRVAREQGKEAMEEFLKSFDEEEDV